MHQHNCPVFSQIFTVDPYCVNDDNSLSNFGEHCWFVSSSAKFHVWIIPFGHALPVAILKIDSFFLF
jgi:hypothetical protein